MHQGTVSGWRGLVAVVLSAMVAAGLAAGMALARPVAAFASDAAFAVYSEDDSSLTFYYGEAPSAGDTYDDKAVTTMYTGFASTVYSKASKVPWYSVRASIESVSFNESFASVQPTACAYWFYGFTACTSFDLEYLDTSAATTLASMFYNCSSLTSLDVSGFNAVKATTVGSMFYGCKGLTSLTLSSGDSSFNTPMATTMSKLFQYCTSLESLDVSTLDTSAATNLSYLFGNCTSLTSIDVSKLDTSAATTVAGMFYYCTGLTSIDISTFDLSRCTSLSYLFQRCTALKTITLGDDDDSIDTSAVTNMSYMFQRCESLEEIAFPESFDTSSVTTMQYMFSNCCSLSELDLTGFDTSSLTNAYFMFYWCTGLTSINVSGWDTSNLANMSTMFACCAQLEEIDLSTWDTSAATDMSQMFYGCASLVTYAPTTFVTSSVTTMQDMFSQCYNLQILDLSSFDTSEVTDMESLFDDDYSLKKIIVGSGWSTDAVTTSTYMFDNCGNLVGGEGTAWATEQISNATYARVDGGQSAPGYLTAAATDEAAANVAGLTVYSSDGAISSVTGYTTLQAAFDAAAALESGTSCQIMLLSDVAEDVAATGGTITFDLYGYTLTNASGHTLTVKSGAAVTVVDTYGVESEAAEFEGAGDFVISIELAKSNLGVVDNTTHAKAALCVEEGGTCALEAGTFRRSAEDATAGSNTYYTIVNQGALTIDGATVELLLADGTAAGYSSIICNGWSSGEPATSGYQATLTIASGTINGGKYLKNGMYGVVCISGGSIVNGANCSILNYDVLYITGGTFEPSSTAVAILANYAATTGATTGSTDISGGAFYYDATTQVIVAGSSTSDDVDISGGEFSGQVPSAYCASGYAATPEVTATSSDGTTRSYYTVAEGTIYFWGGSLRMIYASEASDESTGTEYESSSTDLRFGYSYELPEGATLVSAGWYWGLSESVVAAQKNYVSADATRAAGSYTSDPDDATGLATHLVITGIGSGNFGTEIFAQMWIVYKLTDDEGTTETVTIVGDVETRTVTQIVNAILATDTDDDDTNDTEEVAYAKALAAALES